MPLVLERCTVRPWQPQDASNIAKHANSRRVWLGLRDKFPHPYVTDDAHEFLRKTIPAGASTNFCIAVGGEVGGGIGVVLGEDVHRYTGEIGYWLGEAFWGQGVMTEAVGAFVDYCFGTFALKRIQAELFSSNPASARVLEKNGFTLEGRFRSNVFKDGEMLDSLVYAVIR